MKIFTTILFFFSIYTSAQNLPKGTFYPSGNDNIEIELKENSTYKIVSAKGNYRIKNDTVYLYKSNYAKFNVTLKKGDTSDWIQLNFNRGSSTNNRIRYNLYYGITYNNKLDFYPVNFTEDIITKEIPVKTKILHLVSELQTQASYYDGERPKIIEQYKIPENVTEIDIHYNNSNTLEDHFTATYLKNTNKLVIQKDTLSLQKPVKNNYEEAVSRIVKTDWNLNKEEQKSENLINIHNSSSLKNELKQLKKTNKSLVVFHYPETTRALEKYNKTLTGFKEEIKPKLVYELPYAFYFTDIKTDKKTLEKLGVKNKNQLLVINAENEILLEEYQLSKNVFDDFFYENEFLKKVKRFKIASDFDKAITQENTSLKELTDLFFKIKESKTELNLIDYKNLRKSTPKEVKTQWERLINSYEKDTTFNFDYYALLAYYFSNKDEYSNLLETERNTLNKTDFKAVNYLLKFLEEAENTDTFIQQKRYFNKDFLIHLKNEIFFSKKSQEKFPLQFNSIFLKLIKTEPSITNYNQYFSFLERRNPAKYLQAFGKFSEKYFPSNGGIFENLNSYYEAVKEHKHRTTWNSFKNSISNFFNEASWLIATDFSLDKKTVQLGIKWSETSLKIEPKNPYYLDTLAHLYYINGDKEKGIKTLEEAIKISKETGTAYEHSLDFKQTLTAMKDRTYSPPKK